MNRNKKVKTKYRVSKLISGTDVFAHIYNAVSYNDAIMYFNTMSGQFPSKKFKVTKEQISISEVCRS